MKFVEGVNKNTGMTYVWKKIGLLRNKKFNINWNEWKNKDRNEELKKEMGKIELRLGRKEEIGLRKKR